MRLFGSARQSWGYSRTPSPGLRLIANHQRHHSDHIRQALALSPYSVVTDDVPPRLPEGQASAARVRVQAETATPCS